MLRPQGGSETHGLAAEPNPGRTLAWDGGEARPQTAPGAPGRPTNPSLAESDLFHEVIPRDRLNAGFASVGFHGSVKPHSTWNGWKLPQARGPEAASATAALASTGFTPPASPPSDPLLAACAETKIAPPKPAAGGNPSAEMNTGLESLIEACKATKIAPPVVKAGGAAKLDPAETAANPPVPALAEMGTATDASNAPATAPAGEIELPSLADQGPIPGEAAAPTADPLQTASAAAKIPLPRPADAQAQGLRAASEAAKIPLPVTRSAP